jgi:hypothetical protein
MYIANVHYKGTWALIFQNFCQAGVLTHLVGGADVASELDAKRAIDQSTRLAVMIEEATGKVKYEPATTMTSKLMGMMKR